MQLSIVNLMQFTDFVNLENIYILYIQVTVTVISTGVFCVYEPGFLMPGHV